MVGLLVMDLFVAMLGIHCGMTYANSRVAIGVSLGTVFFLFLGITICILMMISFSGSFHVQLAPFLAFILGGGVGLYVSLGHPQSVARDSGRLAVVAVRHFLCDNQLPVGFDPGRVSGDGGGLFVYDGGDDGSGSVRV